MRAVRDFYAFRRLLRFDDGFRPQGFADAADGSAPPEFGFFSDRSGLLLLAGSETGPVLSDGATPFRVLPGTTIALVEEGSSRVFRAEHAGGRLVIPAPRTGYVEPNYGEDELSDFFVWLRDNLAKDHIVRRLTLR